jgi:hypothetical protein
VTPLGWIRKDRRDGVTGGWKTGPVHRIGPLTGHGSLTLCGKRLKGFGVSYSQVTQLAGDPCARCTANAAQDPVRQDSWKSR